MGPVAQRLAIHAADLRRRAWVHPVSNPESAISSIESSGMNSNHITDLIKIRQRSGISRRRRREASR
jgi:hypothetical protein